MSAITSTITLYKDSAITPARNFVVEDLDTYLTSLTKITILDFQYLRNDLRLTIKINKDQEYVEAINTYNYNYLKVVQKGVSYYYFIMKKTQIAQSTIALELLMDSANTFKWNTAFYPTNRTRVIREHKDRIKKYVANIYFRELQRATWNISEAFPYNDGTPFIVNIELSTSGSDPTITNATARYYESGAHKTLAISNINLKDGLSLVGDLEISLIKVFNEDYSSMYCSIYDLEDIEIEPTYNKIRNIDYFSEGINPILYKEELGLLEESYPIKWNLIYRNAENDQDAVACYIIPESEVNLYTPSKTNFVYTDFVDGRYYIISAFWKNWTWRQTADGYVLVDNKKLTYEYTEGSPWKHWVDAVVIRRQGSQLSYRKIRFELGTDLISGGLPNVNMRSNLSSSWVNFTTLTLDSDKYVANVASIPAEGGKYPYWTDKIVLAETSRSLTTFANVDRVDPKLIKIIKIPYFPSSYTYENDKFSVDDTWVYETTAFSNGSLQLNNLDTHFVNNISSEILNPLDVFELGALNPTLGADRDDYFESKLFHSEFYQPKFVYDSFGFVFELEKINEEEFRPSQYFSFEFIMTSTINSKFMFKFPEYVLKISSEDYDNILPIARNNEAPIYNSTYITYLRTAYRYDLKQYYQKEGLVKFGGAMGAINLGEGAVKAFSDYDKEGVNYFGLFDSFKSFANTFKDLVVARNNNEWGFQSKINQLKNQSNSVSGSDDIDLLENYSGNRAKLCLYKPEPRILKMVADLFYYYGYATNEIKIPVLNTRYWFNYIQCELEITGVDNNITQTIKEDLISRYASGITILHNHAGVWDFQQVKENWETSIL